MSRSVLAVTAGLLSLIILTYIATMVAAVIFISTNNNLYYSTLYLVISVVYTLLFGTAGGFITASVSTETPQRDITILSAIVFLLSIISSILQFQKQPIWYSLILLVSVPIAVLIGGQLRMNKLKKEENSQFK